MFNNSLWYWKLGLQREGVLYIQGKVCCIVEGRFAVESRVRGTHCFKTPYGIGSLDFRGKVCCIVKGRFAVASLIRDTHFNNSLWDWKLGLQRKGMLYSQGKVCC